MNGPHAIRQRLLAKFMVVAAERLGRLEHALASLERGEADAQLIADTMREIHTLKGESRMMGFEAASEAAHRIEDVLLYAKPRGFDTTAGSLLLATDGLDLIRDLLEQPPSDQQTGERLASFAAEVAALGASGPADPTAPVGAAHGTLESPGSDPPKARGAGGRLSDLPSSPEVPPQTPPPAHDPPSNQSATGGMVRIDVARIDATSHITAELSLIQRRQEGLHARLRALHEQLARRASGGAPRTAGDGSAGPGPGDTKWAKALEREIGKLAGDCHDTSFELRTQLDALGSQLDSMRLLPLSTLLDRFPAAIRALARERGKQVRVTSHAGAVAVDHRVVDELSEPLLHLVRNAVDHGIEPPADRRAAGKSPAGQVEIAAHAAGNMVEIEIADDGGGIDIERVRAAAVARGQLSQAQATTLDREGVLSLVFRPGLSTRQDASEISGRGVGLDAAKSAAERLGGWVTVESELGRGTRFHLGVPLHVAVQKLLVVQVGEVLYGLPSGAVHRVLMVSGDEVQQVGGAKVLHTDDLLIPAAELPTLLGQPAAPPDPRSQPVVVLRHRQRLIGLMGGAPRGERSGLRHPLDRFLHAASLVTATTTLENGEMVLLLGVGELYRRTMALPAQTLPAPRHARPRTPRLLIVDDSDLTRDMLVALTRNLGFHISEAINGREALARIESEPPDVVLTDLDMPVMDGWSFITRLRALPATEHTPVIVLSTRGSDDDKRRAMEAGANSYLVKASFDEAALTSMLALYAARDATPAEPQEAP